jgi:hypothetical protein
LPGNRRSARSAETGSSRCSSCCRGSAQCHRHPQRLGRWQVAWNIQRSSPNTVSSNISAPIPSLPPNIISSPFLNSVRGKLAAITSAGRVRNALKISREVTDIELGEFPQT